MIWGTIKLFCPGCGKDFLYKGNCVSGIRYHRTYGYVCSPECWEKIDMKAARLIVGKDDLS